MKICVSVLHSLYELLYNVFVKSENIEKEEEEKSFKQGRVWKTRANTIPGPHF